MGFFINDKCQLSFVNRMHFCTKDELKYSMNALNAQDNQEKNLQGLEDKKAVMSTFPVSAGLSFDG